jgi:hypothetical protein
MSVSLVKRAIIRIDENTDEGRAFLDTFDISPCDVCTEDIGIHELLTVVRTSTGYRVIACNRSTR